MALNRLRGLVPQRPVVRIVLLLAVAGLAIGVAAVAFAGGETAARGPVDASAAPPPAASDAPATAPPAGEDGATAPAATGTTEPGNGTAANDGTVQRSAGSVDTAAAPTDEPATTIAPADEPATTIAPADEPATNETTSTEGAAELIERLRPLVAQPDPGLPAYDRDHFAGWLDADGDCVNTRHEVLQAEAVDFSMNTGGCAVAVGQWFDPYTNRTYTDPSELDVDHVVALADAWVSGAWAWADEVLDRFSNDLGNLNAIAAGENRSKSAKGPAEYSPTASAARCDYLVQYATVKIRWGLSITPRDFEVVEAGLEGCEVGSVPDVARPAPAKPTAEPNSEAQTADSSPPSGGAGPATGCHPAYQQCLPDLPGDALNCGDLRPDQKPVTVLQPGTDPYRLDRDGDGRGCTS